MPLTGSLIRNVQWPLMERFKQNRTRVYMHDLREAQALSVENLKSRQLAKLVSFWNTLFITSLPIPSLPRNGMRQGIARSQPDSCSGYPSLRRAVFGSRPTVI